MQIIIIITKLCNINKIVFLCLYKFPLILIARAREPFYFLIMSQTRNLLLICSQILSHSSFIHSFITVQCNRSNVKKILKIKININTECNCKMRIILLFTFRIALKTTIPAQYIYTQVDSGRKIFVVAALAPFFMNQNVALTVFIIFFSWKFYMT